MPELKRGSVVRALVVMAAVAAVATGTAQSAVYWSNYGSNASGTSIGRANLDGSRPSQTFFSKAVGPVGVTVDRKYLYWSDTASSSCGGTTIGRERINGTAPNSMFIKGIPQPAGLAVNARWIYWAEFANPTAVGGGGLIGRAKLNGSSVNRRLITGASSPAGIAVDALKVSSP